MIFLKEGEKVIGIPAGSSQELDGTTGHQGKIVSNIGTGTTKLLLEFVNYKRDVKLMEFLWLDVFDEMGRKIHDLIIGDRTRDDD